MKQSASAPSLFERAVRVGDLLFISGRLPMDAIKGSARIGGYVAVGEGFVDAPAVVDAAAQVAREELGDRGRHALLALGVASLPLGACVEIEVAVQC